MVKARRSLQDVIGSVDGLTIMMHQSSRRTIQILQALRVEVDVITIIIMRIRRRQPASRTGPNEAIAGEVGDQRTRQPKQLWSSRKRLWKRPGLRASRKRAMPGAALCAGRTLNSALGSRSSTNILLLQKPRSRKMQRKTGGVLSAGQPGGRSGRSVKSLDQGNHMLLLKCLRCPRPRMTKRHSSAAITDENQDAKSAKNVRTRSVWQKRKCWLLSMVATKLLTLQFKDLQKTMRKTRRAAAALPHPAQQLPAAQVTRAMVLSWISRRVL
mmetsp:Transcript_7014/g.12460  ORF Transcript_7014/g.12460 Transcript_7014/m.12460 type:complete len:270 (-) Transcript_7014:257-1066(-)